MLKPILDFFRGSKEASVAETLGSGEDVPLDVQTLVQGGLTELKRISAVLEKNGIDSQIIVPPSGCNS